VIRAALAIARREWALLMGTALGWSVVAASAALAGTVFALSVFQGGAPATLRGTFIAMGWAVLLVAPALSMRSIAEERRAATWASLAASPAGFGAIVLGKFAALVALLALAVAVPALAQLAVLEWFASPDWAEAATGIAGLLLAGAAYVATGILMSALAGNQVGAYLLTVFLWLTWIALAKGVPALLPGRAAYAAFALDPLRRLDDFLFGLFDTGNAAFFLSACAWFLGAAVLTVARPALPAALASRGRVALALAAMAVIAVAAVGIADAPRVRVTEDMTKSRAYTLSPGTESLLRGLDGQWQVGVVLSGATADAAVVRQVDEVLARMAAVPTKDGHVRTARVDPSSPADAARYEAILDAVQQRDAAALQQHADAIAAGRAAFDRLARTAASQAPAIGGIIDALPQGSPDRTELEPLRAAFAQLAAQKRAFDRSIDELRTATDARPFPDEARAAAALATNLKHWGEQLAGVARALKQRAAEPVNLPAYAQWLDESAPAYAALAQELRTAEDGLARLPALHGAEVGAALAAGDAAVIVGPDGVATVPGWQLVGGASGARGSVQFDRRFRGEQAIAGAIRAMRARAQPIAVFVHAGAPNLLRAQPDRMDLSAAADALRAARIEPREWVPGAGPEPIAPAGRPIVWVVLPPVDRDALEDSPRERELLAAARRLVARGEPVLLSVGPSLLPVLGQQDPWAALVRDAGLAPQTGRTVLEVVPTGPGRAETVAAQELQDATGDHPVARAVDGQRIRLDRPVPIELAPGGAAVALAAVEPAAERWIENDWRRDAKGRLEAPESKRFDAPVTVVAAAVRAAAPPRREQRVVVVGSPTWLFTAVADAADQLGGGRIALRNPGNRELLVNAVAWLAGQDELVAGSGAGREVARLPRLPRAVRAGVDVAVAIGLPALVAALGTIVVLRRRLRT
jgi:ABC-2 type transport system permease protein